MKQAILAEPVLVGRERELEELQRCLDSAVRGKGKTVFISGEAGSGKTRVTREFLNAAVKQGVAVMAGWCLSDSQVPYFPFMEAFNSYYAASGEEEAQSNLLQSQAQLGLGTPARVGLAGGEGEITSWLTGARQAGKPIMLSAQAWKDQVFAAVSETLHTIAVQGPVVFFMEDVHWADSASLALLHYVSRAISNSERILLLATYRSEELTTDAEGRAHPLADTLRMMRREELFAEIKLSALSQDSVSKIAENMMGGSLQKELAGKLTDESRGNPLFVVESLRMLFERKSLIQQGDEWHLAVDELGIPTKIKDIIMRRLACLKYVQRRVLDAASVIGEEFNVGLLSAVLGLDSLDVLEMLNLISHSTSIVLDAGNCYRFDHARSREVLYEELSPSLKRGYHAKIAEKLENTKSTIPPLSDLAFHYAQAGNTGKAVEFALLAGKDELAKWSNKQAIKHFLYALQNIMEGCAEEKRTALEGLGDAYASNCMYGEAIKTFDALAASETGVLRLRAIRKASDAAYAEGDKPDLLLEYAKKAQELAVSDRLEMARIVDNRGKAWFWGGRGPPEKDLADYDAALKVFEEENSLVDVAEALWRSGVVCAGFFEDLHGKGLRELLRSVAIFRELGNIRKELEATRWLAQGFGCCGLYEEHKRALVEVLRRGEQLGIFNELVIASYRLSMYYADDCKFEDALSRAFKGLEYSKKTDAAWTHGLAYASIVHLYSLLGDLKQADIFFDIMSRLPQEATSGAIFAVNFVPLAKAVYFAAKGCWKEATQYIDERLRFPIPPQTPERPNLIWMLERQGRFDESEIQREEIQKILDKAEEQFGHANVQLSVMLPRKVHVGEEFEMRLDLVNIARTAAAPTKIDGAFPIEFEVANLPSYCSLQNGSLQFKNKSVGPFQVETVKLRLKVDKAGSYGLNPEINYLDEEGKMKAFKTSSITVTVQPAKPAFEALPGRVTTGTAELDRLLLGGIPEDYGVVLASPSSDERELLISRFLEAGAQAGQTTLYLTVEAGAAKALAENYQLDFSVFICNPQADSMMENLPNVNKLKGVENLTEIDIALTKYFRTLNPAKPNPKRVCVQIVSDVLLQHHAVTTRKWLSALLPNFKSKGFTTLAVIDPNMHPAEEAQAIMSLFEGEIRITEKETGQGVVRSLRIRKLAGQRYSENELVLTKEKLL